MNSLCRRNLLSYVCNAAVKSGMLQRLPSHTSAPCTLLLEVPPQLHHHQHQQQRGVATTRGQRLTVHEKKKVSRALMRARRVKDGSIATVLSGEDWRAYESSMRQGLRELDENSVEMKGQGTYASKPLISRSQNEDEDAEEIRMSERRAWADRMEGVWNEILNVDARAGKPRVSLPGFPIEVIQVKIARDYGHHKIFWDLTESGVRPPQSLLRQLHEARSNGFNAKAVVLKSTAERLRRHEGFLRANLAKRVPMRRVPEVRWLHASKMPESMQLEG